MIDNPDGVSRALHCREPLCVYAVKAPDNILSAVVVEDWFCHLSFWFEGCPRIVAESETLAERIRRKLEKEGLRPLPKIRVMEASDVG
jgi:hypothetical protein